MANEIHYTPKGVLVYPKLTTPDTKFDPAGVYKTALRLPAGVAQPLIDKIEAAIDAKFEETLKELAPAKRKLLKRADKPYKEVYDEEGNETGEFIFNFKVPAVGKNKAGKTWSNKPTIVDAKGKPAAIEPWTGSEGKVAFQLNPFATAIGVGVGLRLKAVQITKLVQGGGANFAFGEEEGFEYDEDAAGEDAGNPAPTSENDYGSTAPVSDDDIPF